MRTEKLKRMTRGWFIGPFSPSVLQTDRVEVGIKHYRAGDEEPKHHHKIATEITVVITGNVEINGKEYGPGDILIVEPVKSAKFKALTDSINVVVKIPGVKDDKYIDEK